MDIAMTTVTTVAASRPRTSPLSALGMGITQPLPWHGDVARTALAGAGNAAAAGFVGRRVSDVPSSAVAGFRTDRTVVADTRTAKQPHPPRGVPR